jgi:hypothetical protein
VEQKKGSTEGEKGSWNVERGAGWGNRKRGSDLSIKG